MRGMKMRLCERRIKRASGEFPRREDLETPGMFRTVDTQVPQSSIYLWGEQGARTYTDTDFELYGLPDEGIWTVRAAYAILLHSELGDLWREAGCRCLEQAKAALKAAKQGETVEF